MHFDTKHWEKTVYAGRSACIMRYACITHGETTLLLYCKMVNFPTNRNKAACYFQMNEQQKKATTTVYARTSE